MKRYGYINRFLDKSDFLEYDKLKKTNNYAGIKEFFITKISERNIPLVGTSLDGVYSKNFPVRHSSNIKQSSCKAVLFVDGKRVKPMMNASDIQAMAIDKYKGNKSEIASDHLPVITKIRF